MIRLDNMTASENTAAKWPLMKPKNNTADV